MTSARQLRLVEGVVKSTADGGKFVVEIPGGHCILAEISAKIKVRFTVIEPGTRVRCEIAPAGAAKARIVGRLE
ncbi:translation initiation factor IF-1 [bacterium]|nr:translation initiation factor IF-1 [bacterium]